MKIKHLFISSFGELVQISIDVNTVSSLALGLLHFISMKDSDSLVANP